MAIATVAELLTALKSLHLLVPEQADLLAREVMPTDPRSVAKNLVQRGWLTPFQANELFLGRGANLLLGSYVLLESVGEGGMGQVFKARNWKLGHVRALKLIRKERLANPNAVRRFQREIRMAAQLQHPNIVRAFDADTVNGTHFFVMEFVEGTDLHKVVKSQGPLEVRRACEYIRQVALGLQHAHERGLVHRDIKPHNLLLSMPRSPSSAVKEGTARSDSENPRCVDNGLVKILDMGLARIDSDAEGDHSSTMTQEGHVMGTPDYIAPEQGYDSHTVDIRADLYSLGCTFYYLLTGKAPFPGGSLMEKLVKHQQRQARPIGEFRSDVPDTVVAVVAKLMAKHPTDRCQTPAELVAALDDLVPQLDEAPAPWIVAMNSAPSAEAPTPAIPSGPSSTDRLARREWAQIAPAEAAILPAQPAPPRRSGKAIAAGVALLLVVSGIWMGTRPAPEKKPDDDLVITLPPRPKPRVFNDGKGDGRDPDKKPTLAAVPGPVTDAWIKTVQALPADEQAESVFAKLKQLNEGFDDRHIENKFEKRDGQIVELSFKQVCTDISPLRALTKLEKLTANPMLFAHYNAPPVISLADLASLKGLPLKSLNLQGQRLGDLTPLAGLPLETLNVSHSLVKDLAPLAKCRTLKTLDIHGTLVADLGPLQDLPLETLNASNTFVDDLGPLATMPLRELVLRCTGVRDLAPLRGLKKLDRLVLDETRVTDLSPLADLRVTYLNIEGMPQLPLAQLPDHNIGVSHLICNVRSQDDVSALQRLAPAQINHQQAATFFRIMRPDEKHQEFLKQVVMLRSKALVDAVCARLGALNGMIPAATFEEDQSTGAVTKLHIHGPRNTSDDPSKLRLADLTPLEALPRLRSLEIDGQPTLAIQNLWPLRQMRLEKIKAPIAAVDLSPLAGMPLRSLDLPFVGSVAPLAGCPLESITYPAVETHDLTPLRDMPLKSANIHWYIFKDLEPLRHAPLKTIHVNFVEERHGKTLRAMKQLETINSFSADQFWKEHARQQAEFVRRELVRLNPGFDGKIEYSAKDGVVVAFAFRTSEVSDIAPVRYLPSLESLTMSIDHQPGKVNNLAPLQGMKLNVLDIHGNPVADLTPLKGMPLTSLKCDYTKVADLSPLRGMKLRHLGVFATEVTDLSVLRGMPLNSLFVNQRVNDVSMLHDMPIQILNLRGCRVADLRFVEGMPLSRLDIIGVPLTDLAPLTKLPGLQVLDFDFQPYRGDPVVLRPIKSLNQLNGKLPDEFWMEFDEQQAEFDQWCAEVGKLQAKEQLNAVLQRLQKHNPKFEPVPNRPAEFNNNQVVFLDLLTSEVADISPVRALKSLKNLAVQGDSNANGKLIHLWPLCGLSLEELNVSGNKGLDLSGIKGMKLKGLAVSYSFLTDLRDLDGIEFERLGLQATLVADLTPLRGRRLTYVNLRLSPVKDLEPLRGMPLTEALIPASVTNLEPLRGMPLETLILDNPSNWDLTALVSLPKLKQLTCNFQAERDAPILRQIKSLKTINGKPAAELLKQAP